MIYFIALLYILLRMLNLLLAWLQGKEETITGTQ
jgi:hypothetical protein